jgi:hypothetical protein
MTRSRSIPLLALLIGVALLSIVVSLQFMTADLVTTDRAAFIRGRMGLAPQACPLLTHKISFWTAMLQARHENDLAFDASGDGTVNVADSILLFTTLLAVEANCVPPHPGHFLFVTSQALPLGPDFSSNSYETCRTAALNGGFEGLWLPLLSNSGTNIRDLITVQGPVYSTRPLTGQPGRYVRLARDETDFWDGTLENAICNEFGDCSQQRQVRTGSLSDGTRYSTDPLAFCNNWKSAYSTLAPTPYGSTHNGQWLRVAGGTPISCTANTSIYCFQQTPASVCGNGLVEIGETCDWGDDRNGTGCTPAYGQSCTACSSTCRTTTIHGGYCGDGIIQGMNAGGPELCDNGKHCLNPQGVMVSCTTDASVCAQPTSCAKRDIDGCNTLCQPHGQMAFTILGNNLLENFQGLEGADALCQMAVADKYPGTWKAILSDSQTNARDRLPITGPVFNTRLKSASQGGWVPDRQLVALNAEEFWSGTLRASLNYDQHGYVLSSFSPAVTGSDAEGRRLSSDPALLCEDWSWLNDEDAATPGTCGNGRLDHGEECDNGVHCRNRVNCSNWPDRCDLTPGSGLCLVRGGNGCSATCRVETGWTCTNVPGQPSDCTQVDGRLPTGNPSVTTSLWAYDPDTTISCMTQARLYCLQMPQEQ